MVIEGGRPHVKKFFVSLILLVALLPGCASFESFAKSLNERKVQSCVYWSGFAGGPLSGAQVQVKGVTATGGVVFETCLGEKNAN